MRTDYHFHPNLPLGFPIIGNWWSQKKAQRIWHAFYKHQLDAVLITEHAYKQPIRAYEFLLQNQPEHVKTEIYPGIEILTKEGIELIAFAKEPTHIFKYQSLLTPWQLSIEQAIELIADDLEIQGIVIHPYTPGTTSIVRKGGYDKAVSATSTLGLLEQHNMALASTQAFLEKTKVHHLLKRKYQQMCDTKNVPTGLPELARVRTCGSDAHHVWEIGDCMDITTAALSRDEKYTALCTTTGTLNERTSRPVLGLIISMGTVAREFFMKKLRLYSVESAHV